MADTLWGVSHNLATPVANFVNRYAQADMQHSAKWRASLPPGRQFGNLSAWNL